MKCGLVVEVISDDELDGICPAPPAPSSGSFRRGQRDADRAAPAPPGTRLYPPAHAKPLRYHLLIA